MHNYNSKKIIKNFGGIQWFYADPYNQVASIQKELGLFFCWIIS